jgi:hypothetical protein
MVAHVESADAGSHQDRACKANEMLFVMRLRPLQGRMEIANDVSGGIASLNPRLIAATPPGSMNWSATRSRCRPNLVGDDKFAVILEPLAPVGTVTFEGVANAS